MRSRNRRSQVAWSAVRETYVSGVDTLSPQTRTYNLNSISVKNAALNPIRKSLPVCILAYSIVTVHQLWDMNHCTHTSQTCHPHYESFQTRPFSNAMQQRFSWATSCKYSQPQPQKVAMVAFAAGGDRKKYRCSSRCLTFDCSFHTQLQPHHYCSSVFVERL